MLTLCALNWWTVTPECGWPTMCDCNSGRPNGTASDCSHARADKILDPTGEAGLPEYKIWSVHTKTTMSREEEDENVPPPPYVVYVTAPPTPATKTHKQVPRGQPTDTRTRNARSCCSSLPQLSSRRRAHRGWGTGQRRGRVDSNCDRGNIGSSRRMEAVTK